MKRRWPKIALIGLGIAIAICFVDGAFTMYWVGSTDLEVVFEVTSASTQTPIPDARIVVRQSPNGIYEFREKEEFVLTTDKNGKASRLCEKIFCFGTQSLLRFTDSFSLHPPDWQYSVHADGWSPLRSASLLEYDASRKTKRVGSRKASLLVPIKLKT